MSKSNHKATSCVVTKKLIIMKICKNLNYNDFKNWLLGIRKSNYNEGITNADKEYFMLKDLIQYIESIY